MGPGQIWRDLCRIVQGTVAFVHYLRSQETIGLALGVFESSSSTVMVGRPCHYRIRIANVSETVWDVKVTLEISSSTPAHPAAKPSARFATHCTILPHRTTEVGFHYDWHASAGVIVDKVASPPDECWMGEIQTAPRYRVSAVLSDQTGKHLDRLDMYQELKG
jgi:hypothetical protein